MARRRRTGIQSAGDLIPVPVSTLTAGNGPASPVSDGLPRDNWGGMRRLLLGREDARAGEWR
jgi:hypothetical protein